MSKDRIEPRPLNEVDRKREQEETNRPGFDLGGAKGKDSAGRGLGLGTDAKEDRDGQRLPRKEER
jgi:hypothetical protein